MLNIVPDQEQLVGIIRGFDGLQERINRIPSQMDEQLDYWQRDDLNRAQPQSLWADAQSLMTQIFARGRSREEWAARRARGRQVHIISAHYKARRTGNFFWSEHRRRGQRLARARQYAATSSRPVVRYEAMDRLTARMRALMEAAFIWQR